MRAAKRFFSRPQNVVGLAIVGLFALAAITAPILTPQDGPYLADSRVPDTQPQPPSREMPLGYLPPGVDVFEVLLYGTSSALLLGLIVASSAATIGTLIGAVSAYVGGWVNRLVMRVTDSFVAFPVIAGVALFRLLFSPAGPLGAAGQIPRVLGFLPLEPVVLALILFSWMPYTRVINASVTQLLGTEYILAAHVIGAPASRIVLRHLIPNAIAPVLTLAARDVGGIVTLVAAFTFIGVGGGSPWGSILVVGRNWIIGPYGNVFKYWWAWLPASLALTLFSIGWNLIGDGLNAALDPRAIQNPI